MVAKNFLTSLGVLPLAQFPYRDEVGLLHVTDFYDSSTRIAYEVKTGKFESNSIYYFRIEPLLYSITSNQFSRVIYVNVRFLGRVGFAESIRRRIRSFGTITLC
jgi:hypothetical protein